MWFKLIEVAHIELQYPIINSNYKDYNLKYPKPKQ
jgi:hypothetical protein